MPIAAGALAICRNSLLRFPPITATPDTRATAARPGCGAAKGRIRRTQEPIAPEIRVGRGMVLRRRCRPRRGALRFVCRAVGGAGGLNPERLSLLEDTGPCTARERPAVRRDRLPPIVQLRPVHGSRARASTPAFPAPARVEAEVAVLPTGPACGRPLVKGAEGWGSRIQRRC
jgi:hypothetical protein